MEDCRKTDLRRTRAGLCRWALVLAWFVWGVEQPARAESLAERIQPLIDAHQGQVAVAIRHLETGESWSCRATEPMPTASLIKFPVMIEAYRQAQTQRLDLTRHIVLQETDKVPGAGILTTHFSAGTSISIRDAIRLMIAFSDNTATNLVLGQIGLPATARCMEELGCPNTKLHSLVFRRDTSIFPERSERFGLGSTTADEMLQLLVSLHEGRLVSPEASAAMREHLRACDDKLKFRRLIPAEVKLACKTGSVDAARTAAGLLELSRGTVALCVLTDKNEDTRWTDDNAGDLLCARIARAVYDHFETPSKCEPLSVPESEITGGGDDEDDEKPEDVAASAKLPDLLPRDPLSGPPFTACRNWAVADAVSGKVLWESKSSDVVDTASTTKIMTAYVILSLAAERPAVLDETVVFSERADKTAGSSSGVRVGEKLPVRELLYGLLLPSGNDAAVALAEHFGPRFDPPAKKPGLTDSISRFVAEMNRTASRLKMSDTRYLNPNGLPEKGHASSARDLVKLTAVALRNRVFRECVSSRRHETQVTARDGTQRSVTWKSTNRLLAITGYSGVKTGYTRAAGSCLVSTGQRGKDNLIVVVLGAPSAAAAVADSRNLYRWAWRERGQRD
ncbi:MAG: serine hydrolase [Planctomycetes bacterium]|nr:serine hydrolase [Planctomycetota bacterium]